MIEQVQQTLEQTFGFDTFRQGQEQTVMQLLRGESSLAIFPTGSGKSLCYQLPALLLPNLTLVVSPLLALIKDQLTFLHNKGIAAASLDSTLTFDESRNVMQSVRTGETKILFVSVERFKNERFRHFIQSVPISMLVVDEAHCISEWGHNFRPDYLKLPNHAKDLNIPLVLLLTATATVKVKQDMAQYFAIQSEHIVQTGFYRPNLHLAVQAVHENEKQQALVSFLSQQTGAGIVYVTLQQTAADVASELRHQGFAAVAYHAGLPDEQRQSIQADFMSSQNQIIVATIAFGMGIDKSDIRFVVHFDLPKSIENYSQEIGRAGRDGQVSQCLTLANLDGVVTLENFVYGDTPELPSIKQVFTLAKEECEQEQAFSKAQWEVQLHALSSQTNIRQLALKTLLVKLELLKVIQAKLTYFAEFKYKFIQERQTVLDTFEGERRTFLERVFAPQDMKKVWGEVNFDRIYQTYQAERGRVITALEYLHEQNLIELSSKKSVEVYQVDLNALNSSQLAAELFNDFKQKEQSEVERIANLIDFFEQSQCLSYTLAQYFDDQAAPNQCGHCSVCNGQQVKLSYSNAAQWPENELIAQYIDEFEQSLQTQANILSSPDLISRFLAGIALPIFTKIKARKLSGFGKFEKQRYCEILKRVSTFF